MAKHIKMLLYGEPGTGKSVFACKAPNPFFVCSDGNYEWLEDFGAKPEAHIDTADYEVFKDLIDKGFPGYDTVVIDLLEDFFKFCELAYCVRNNIEHVSDQGYGKAYDATRDGFFLTIAKLLTLPKNVILIMHGNTWTEKDRRGVEHTKHGPSSRLPGKVLDMIEGRVRYALRCYTADEELENGDIKIHRYLSLVPKPNEWGICRGINELKIPQDIDLDWNVFCNAIGYTFEPEKTEAQPVEVKTEETHKRKRKAAEPIQEAEPIKEAEPTTEPETVPSPENETPEQNNVETPTETENTAAAPATSNEDKLAAIRAKLAAMKKG